MPIIQARLSETPRVGLQSASMTWPLAMNFAKRLRELSPDEASQLIDFISREDGLVVRDSFSQLGAIALNSDPIRLAQFEREEDDRFTVAHTQERFYVYDGTTWQNRTRVSGDYTGSTPWHSAVVLNEYVFTDYNDKIQRWDGTAADAVDLTAAGGGNTLEFVKAKYVLAFAGRLLLLNLIEEAVPVTRALRVRWSIEADFDASVSWSALGSGAADLAETPDAIVGAARLGNLAVIYKERSIVHCIETGDINAPLNFLWRQSAGLDRGQGLVSQATLGELLNTHIGLWTDNVYIYDGVRPRPVGDAVIRRVVREAGSENLRKAFAAIIPSESWYILWVPSAGQSIAESAYVYDFRRDLWISEFRKKATSASVHVAGGTTTWDTIDDLNWDDFDVTWDSFGAEVGLAQLIVGNPDSDEVEITNEGVDPDGPLGAIWRTGDFDFSFSGLSSTVRRVRVRVDTGGSALEMTCSISGDSGNTFPISQSVTSAAQVGEQDLFFDIVYTANRHMFQFATSERIRILEWEPFFQVRGPLR